ncbi:hypothetical protein BCV70DRAFT_198455 [Testicularia cyperi]|uniref:Nitroreductase domain-containing protein n=1 Tax=Testicularia cyperi TaxID=1882483 RepID=A0A317XWG7_9BASI|nr:hypothetical protein BCV70DRAFT_198455 [Testicularia cyperi]
MSLPQATKQLLSQLAVRRTNYALTKVGADAPILTSAQVKEVVSEAVKISPSSFDSRSSRVVVLDGAEHDVYWTKIVPESLSAAVKSQGGDDAAVEKATSRLPMFAAAQGTVLVFESNAVVQGMQKNVPAYSHMFPVWSQHASGMLQYNLWTALTNSGYGVNIQHYGNLTEATLKQKYSLPDDWQLHAELVYGAPKEEPKPREYDAEKENKERIRFFGQ